MPIIAKSELAARRAAKAALNANTPPKPPATPNQPVVQARAHNCRSADKPVDPSTVAPPAKPKPAVRAKGEKNQPTGDYPVGFCRTPEETRFKKGKPGPGRPKGSVSHDTLLKREFEKKRSVRINGRAKTLTHRELMVTQEVMAAVEGKDRHARKQMMAESARLYGPDDRPTAANDVALTESDALSIKEAMADLRDEIRAELLREIAAGKATGQGDAE